MRKLSRREFLRVTATFSASAYLSPLIPTLTNGEDRKNVLILLFDTMSARHLSLYGYPRETSPNLSRFADRATVYHSHYAAGNFTSPSTASLFTGMYPWKHRAYPLSGLVRRDLVKQNLFELLGREFYRVSFAQTGFADILMQQFLGSVEKNLPSTAFSISGPRFFMDRFLHERELTTYLFDEFATHLSPDPPGVLFGGYLSTLYQLRHGQYFRYGFPEYPKGLPILPATNIAFRLEDVFAGILEEVRDATSKPLPHFSYYHLYAPHEPSNPHKDFIKLFKDDFKPIKKPDHPLGEEYKYHDLVGKQQMYDRYVANVDHEFGLLIDRLEKDGLLRDTYVIVTSDHGQLFERSYYGHGGPLLFDGNIHIPLLIRVPGQTTRTDVRSQTNNVDLLPTLLSLLGKDIPQNVDGKLLPEFGGVEDTSRAFHSMAAHRMSAFGPMREGTFAIQKASYKLIFYKGYKNYRDVFEFYDIHEDPDELNDLMTKAPPAAGQMKDQLLDALDTADRPYQRATAP